MDESSDGETNWPKSFKPILKGGSKYFVIDEYISGRIRSQSPCKAKRIQRSRSHTRKTR